MTITNIIAEIIAEVGEDSSDTTMAANMLTFLKGACRMIPLYTKERSVVVISPVTLSADAYTASLPSGFIEERQLFYVESNKPIPITKITEAQMIDRQVREGSGAPKEYRIYGATIEFTRKADQSYTVYVEYFKMDSAVAGGDTFVGSEQLVEALKALTKSKYYGSNEDDIKRDSYASQGISILRTINGKFIEQELGTHAEEV